MNDQLTHQQERSLSRRERERRMRRRAMLEAACTVFAEKGYTHATVDEIAQRAEFGKGTLYNYFSGGKEDILFAIFDEIYDDLCELIEASFSSPPSSGESIREQFEAFITACLQFFIDRQDLFMILMKEAHRMVLSEDQEKAAYFMRQRDRVASALVPPLEAAIARGELRPLPPEAVAHMILGNINGCQMHMMLDRKAGDSACGEEDTAASMAAFLTTMLFDGLLARPDAPPPNVKS